MTRTPDLPDDWQRSVFRHAVGFATGAAAVAAITAAAFAFHLNLATAALFHVVVIVMVARRDGFRVASAVSILAAISQLYYLVPPVLTWVVADPQNWVALAAFEYCALTVSRLSNRAAQQTQAAERSRLDVERLFRTSQLVLLMDTRTEPAPQLTAMIRELFRCDAVSIFESATARWTAPGALDSGVDSGMESRAREVSVSGMDYHDAAARTWYRVIRSGNRSAGALVLRGGEIGEPVANALASLVSVALDRAMSLQKESRAEAARQSELLRTAVLDALAHEVKTPLTVIRAASTGLTEVGGLAPYQAELGALIESECGRLTEITDSLLRMANLDAGEVRVAQGDVALGDIVNRIVAKARAHDPGRAITVAGMEAGFRVQGDETLVGMALTQLLENALKYSSPGSEVSIDIGNRRGEAVVAVHNVGPAIAAGDLERVFQRFYRGEGAKTVAGSGLGLSITRKIAAAHGGRVWAVSDEIKGTSFFLALPVNGQNRDGMGKSAR